MVGHCSCGQISEIKQCCHVGTLGHSEKCVLVFKRKKGFAKSVFFKSVPEVSVYGAFLYGFLLWFY